MSDYLTKSTHEILSLSKKELLTFLVNEAKCSQEDISSILKMPERDVLEFLISRLRGRAVNIDYTLMLDTLSNDKQFTDSVTTEIIKTIATTVEVDIMSNTLDIEIAGTSIELSIQSNLAEVNFE